MKRRNYRYILYCFSILLLGTAAAYLSTIFSISSLSFKGEKETDRAGPKDSLQVVELNKEAFNFRLSNPQKTTTLADSALTIAKSIGYLGGIAESYRLIGIGAFYQNDIDFAIRNYLKSLKYYEILRDKRNQAKVYNNIGNLYNDINDPSKSLFYFNKSLNISQVLNDQELTAGLYFNIARAYEQQNRYNEALVYFEKCYEFFKRTKDEVYITLYFQNTGLVYFKQGNLKKAESLLITAVSRAKELKLYKTLCGCYLMLSRIYMQNRDYSRAKRILNEGLYYADMLNDQDVTHELIYKQYELQRALKNYKGAVEILASLYQKDSLNLNQELSQNIGITSRHYIQQQKLQEKELTITRQKYREATLRWIIALSFSVFLLCALIGLIVHLVRQKRRKIREITIQNDITSLEQKALQAMMNPHFLFNIMNSIRHFISQADIETANQILSEFARLVRKHLEICMTSSISVQDELVYLQLYLSLEKARLSDKMGYQISVDDNIDTEEIMLPSMLIQPFVENAVWHGIAPKEEGGTIKLSFDLVESSLLISVIDDGVGIENSKKTAKVGHKSHGMDLIYERVSLLNKLSDRPTTIDQRQTGDYGTAILISIPVLTEA